MPLIIYLCFAQDLKSMEDLGANWDHMGINFLWQRSFIMKYHSKIKIIKNFNE